MATRKTGTRKTTRKPPLKPASKGAGNRMPVSAAFRIFLLIVIIIAFFTLLPIIKNLRLNAKAAEQVTDNREQVTEENERKEKNEERKKEDEKKLSEEGTEGKKPQTEKPAASTQTPPPKTPVKEPEKKPQAEKPAVTEQPEKKPQTEKPTTTAQPSTPTAPVSTPPVKPPVETRDRSIYLIQESTMAQVKVNRKLNVSNTPLLDSLNALLAGPTADEKRRGMESLVPEGSRLLSARVDGSTAILDFNQEFRYNTRGSEGCAAQIKQIVWTATEFPNVQNVQFLIEGQKVDFLSEGVTIRSPIGR